MSPLRWFQGIADAVRDGIAGLWAGLLSLADGVLAWLVEGVATLLEALSALFFGLLAAVGATMPEVSAPNHAAVDSGLAHVAWVNTYLPMTEVLGLLAVWVLIFSGIGLVKVLRLVSPVSS